MPYSDSDSDSDSSRYSPALRSEDYSPSDSDSSPVSGHRTNKPQIRLPEVMESTMPSPLTNKPRIRLPEVMVESTMPSRTPPKMNFRDAFHAELMKVYEKELLKPDSPESSDSSDSGYSGPPMRRDRKRAAWLRAIEIMHRPKPEPIQLPRRYECAGSIIDFEQKYSAFNKKKTKKNKFAALEASKLLYDENGDIKDECIRYYNDNDDPLDRIGTNVEKFEHKMEALRRHKSGFFSFFKRGGHKSRRGNKSSRGHKIRSKSRRNRQSRRN